MARTTHNQRQQAAVWLTIFLGTIGMSLPSLTTQALGETGQAQQRRQLTEDADKLLKGNRSVLGRVQAITSDQIKVDIGEVQPRFLPLKQAQQKGFPEIQEGDDLIVVLNAENLLVDYHLLDGEASAHTVIRGEVAQNLPVGQERVVIKSGGKERSFTIRSQVRSKVAAIPVGTAAVFLIDETNQIADVALSNKQAGKAAGHQSEQMSPIKGAHRQVDGTVTTPLKSNHITVRTPNGTEKPYEVREMLQPKIAALHPGDAVILLVDTENKVIDVAIPPHGK